MSARESVLAEMARDLETGAWDPIGDDLRLREVFAYPPDTTPTFAEMMSKEMD